jgi:hypothetical protein
MIIHQEVKKVPIYTRSGLGRRLKVVRYALPDTLWLLPPVPCEDTQSQFQSRICGSVKSADGRP